MLFIRPEQANEYHSIFELNKKAFNSEVESCLVEKLRKTKGFIPELSLVAIKDGNVVGHIPFSVIQIKTDSKKIPVFITHNAELQLVTVVMLVLLE